VFQIQLSCLCHDCCISAIGSIFSDVLSPNSKDIRHTFPDVADDGDDDMEFWLAFVLQLDKLRLENDGVVGGDLALTQPSFVPPASI
jgi:hypothetical protein